MNEHGTMDIRFQPRCGPVEVSSNENDFDIFGWWKQNSSPMYPIISCKVRDLLTIQVLTVISESAFNIGG